MPAAHSRNVQQFDLYKYLRIVWRRKWLLIVPIAVCLPAAVLAAWLYPTEYESQAVLEVQDNRPLAETGPVRINVGTLVMSVRTRAMSYSAIREVVLSRKVDFGREIDPDDRRQLDRIYSEISRRTRVTTQGGSHLFISHRSTSPERNASLVNEVVKKFVGEDRRESQDRAKQDLKYYNDKLASAKTHLGEIDSQLREFAQANPWLGETLADVHREYKDAEDEELAIRRSIKGVEEGLADLKKQLSKEKPELVIKRKVDAPPEVLAARNRAKQAQAYFENVDARYTSAHPKWQEAKGILDKSLAELKEIDKGGEDFIEESQPNPVYTALQDRITAREKELERFNQRKVDASKRVSELYVRVRKAPELLGEKRALEEQRAVAANTAADYASGVRAAEKELQRLMTDAYSSRVRVIEYARDDRRPVKSTQMKIIALGVLLGLLTGAALVGLMEYLDQTFKSIDDARDYLDIPALGVIPAIFTPRDHRRRLWFRVLAISSAVFVVGVGVAIYLKVPATREYINMAWVKFQEWMEYW